VPTHPTTATMDLGICKNLQSFGVAWGGLGLEDSAQRTCCLVCYLNSVLYCLENAFVSRRLRVCIWFLGVTGVLPYPKPLCPPYLQSLAVPLSSTCANVKALSECESDLFKQHHSKCWTFYLYLFSLQWSS